VLQGQYVLGLLHDADLAPVALLVGADRTGVGIGNVAADGAKPGLLLYRQDGIRQLPGLLLRGAQQVVGEALGALGPDAGQPVELPDKPG
jgi:hypothetical protein